MNAQMRNTTLNAFLTNKLNVIVCNNLGARGLDLGNCQHVIQFDCSKTITDYLHRYGRVGQLGQPGKVTNFVRKTDVAMQQ